MRKCEQHATIYNSTYIHVHVVRPVLLNRLTRFTKYVAFREETFPENFTKYLGLFFVASRFYVHVHEGLIYYFIPFKIIIGL